MSSEYSADDANPHDANPQQKFLRADKQNFPAPQLKVAQSNFIPAVSAQTENSSPATIPPQGIRSRWASAEQKLVPQKLVQPADSLKRNRRLFLIALVTIAPILAVVSAVLSDTRFMHIFQEPRQQALLARTIGRSIQGGNNPGMAMILYGLAHNLDPTEPNYLTDIGLLKEQTGDVAGAKAAFLASIRIAPSARAYNDLGICYDQEGKLQQAISAYNDALALDSGWAMAWNNRGLAFGKLKQYEQSVSDYSQAIKLRYATSYFGRCETYAALGRNDLAARDAAIIRRHGYTNTTFCFMSESPSPDEQ